MELGSNQHPDRHPRDVPRSAASVAGPRGVRTGMHVGHDGTELITAEIVVAVAHQGLT